MKAGRRRVRGEKWQQTCMPLIPLGYYFTDPLPCESAVQYHHSPAIEEEGEPHRRSAICPTLQPASCNTDFQTLETPA